jgi:hypothetical protein
MGEKWFQFVSRIKKETGVGSLKEAMKIASERKSEWQKDGQKDGVVVEPIHTKGKTGKNHKGKKAKRGTRKEKK